VSPFTLHKSSIGVSGRYMMGKECSWITNGYPVKIDKSIEVKTYSSPYLAAQTVKPSEDKIDLSSQVLQEFEQTVKPLEDKIDLSSQVRQIDKIYIEQEFEETVVRIIMGIKKIKKYIDSNSNELCPYVIISHDYIFNLKEKEIIEFIKLFKVNSGLVKIIDKIHLITDFMLVFLKSEEDFDEFSSVISSCNKYKMWGEMDFMYPGFFDYKYAEIQTIICKIRTENMNKDQENLKIRAKLQSDDNNEESQRILARKELEKLMRKMDIDIINTEQLYDLLKIKTPNIINILQTYRNKPVFDLENLIRRITCFVLKQFICDDMVIKYHPLVYCASVIMLLIEQLPNNNVSEMFFSVGARFDEELKLIRQVESNGIHSFLGLSKDIVVKLEDTNKDIYCGAEMTLRKISDLKQFVNKFINDTKMLCFKEVILHNFILITHSKMHADGLFEDLPKDVLIIIIRNMTRMLNNY
jgi:hypothetical protein